LIKPYYSDEWVTIYHGDNRELLPEISGDLLATDPPYNVGIDYGVYTDKLTTKDYHSLIKWLVHYAKTSVGGNMALVLGSKLVLDWWQFIPEAKLVIVKMGAVSNNKIKGLHLQYHPLLTTVKSNKYMSDLWEDIRWPGEGYYFNEDRYGHPAMTPEKLARRMVSIFSKAGQTIVDPYLGIGTFAVASKVLNRKCIGIEIEEKYCEIAAKRCSQQVFDFREVSRT